MTFLFPAGFLLSVLSLPIVAMYFLRIRRRKVAVPSLLLWHALQKSERLASPFDRFRKHLLLFLQLLLLLLLVLALTRPSIQTEASTYRSVVLVVDTSASMGATDGTPTRLAEAIGKAEAALADLGPSDEVLLIEAGPQTGVRVPFTRDEGVVGSALAELVASEAEGSLLEGVQLGLSLARSRPKVEVIVLSDGGSEDLGELAPSNAEITYVRVGSQDDNAGILALDLRRSPANDLDRQLFLTVQNFGDKPVDATVELYLDTELLGLRNETLQPDVPVSMVFEVAGERSGVLRAELTAPGDLLAADNQAVAVLGRAATREILLVGGDALTTRVLQADPRVTLKVVRQATAESLASADAVLFGSEAPGGLDGLNYAVLSSKYGGPAELGDPVDLPRILGWQRTHPTLRFVNLANVTVARAASVGNTGGLVPIVDSDSGPLILAGERNGGRVVQLAFDPFESDLPMRVAWPVFILNTVGWLTEADAGSTDATLIPAGAPFTRQLADEGAQVKVTGPAGPVKASVIDRTLRVMDTHRIGVYHVRAGDLELDFATNLLSPKESRIAPLPVLRLGQGAAAVAQASVIPGQRELWRYLLAIALVVLCVEWFAWNRRKTA